MAASGAAPSAPNVNRGARPLTMTDVDVDDLQALVQQMEAYQAQQHSPQMPTPELDALLILALRGRPERRARLAVMARSALLRRKILACIPDGGRSIGSSMLGESHLWRGPANPEEWGDHNWPDSFTVGTGTKRPDTLGRNRSRRSEGPPLKPVEQLRMDPTLERTATYSVPRATRFAPGGEYGKGTKPKDGTPGPSDYFKSLPRGVSYSDGYGGVVLKANHSCPWKNPLGHHINPIESDQTVLQSQPTWTFPKTRRCLSEVAMGQCLQDGGPVKSDTCCLSPGPIYDAYSCLQPAVDHDGPPPREMRVRLKKKLNMSSLRSCATRGVLQTSASSPALFPSAELSTPQGSGERFRKVRVQSGGTRQKC